jgi:hypothetical protein
MMDANPEDEKNPWITVSKSTRRSFPLKDTLQTPPKRPEVTNNFHNLTLDESSGSNSSALSHPAPAITEPQPPRKKVKKEKSHYPTLKINDQFVNKQVALTVLHVFKCV